MYYPPNILRKFSKETEMIHTKKMIFLSGLLLTSLNFLMGSASFCGAIKDGTEEKNVAIYASSLAVCGDDILQRSLDTSYLDRFSKNTTKNYMQSNFFIAGDVRGSGRQIPYRELNLQTQNKKRFLWRSNQAPDISDIEDFEYVESVTNGGHTERQFCKDMREVFMGVQTLSFMKQQLEDQKKDVATLNTLIWDTLRTNPLQFLPFMVEEQNTKIHSYGFVLHSVFDVCSDCLLDLHTFMEDRGRSSLHDFMQNSKEGKNSRIDTCSQLKPRIIVHSNFPYRGSLYRLVDGDDVILCDYTYSDDEGMFSLIQKNTNDVKWNYEEDNIVCTVVGRPSYLFRSSLPQFSSQKMAFSLSDSN